MVTAVARAAWPDPDIAPQHASRSCTSRSQGAHTVPKARKHTVPTREPRRAARRRRGPKNQQQNWRRPVLVSHLPTRLKQKNTPAHGAEPPWPRPSPQCPERCKIAKQPTVTQALAAPRLSGEQGALGTTANRNANCADSAAVTRLQEGDGIQGKAVKRTQKNPLTSRAFEEGDHRGQGALCARAPAAARGQEPAGKVAVRLHWLAWPGFPTRSSGLKRQAQHCQTPEQLVRCFVT